MDIALELQGEAEAVPGDQGWQLFRDERPPPRKEMTMSEHLERKSRGIY